MNLGKNCPKILKFSQAYLTDKFKNEILQNNCCLGVPLGSILGPVYSGQYNLLTQEIMNHFCLTHMMPVITVTQTTDLKTDLINSYSIFRFVQMSRVIMFVVCFYLANGLYISLTIN